MRLPGEDELREHIQRELAVEFQVVSDILAAGTGIFQPGVSLNPKENMDHLEAWMCLGIVAKACRQYRGIGALAEIGLGDVADNNGRMLSETMLAAQFLMRPTLVLKRGGNPLPDVAKYPLTTAFRTKLYMAHDAARTLTMIREMVKCGDMTGPDAASTLSLAELEAQEMAAGIGPEWAKRQKESGSYSGLKILELAESLDMPFIYHTFYRPSSAGVHGTDARKHIDAEERPDGGIAFSTCSSPKGVAEALIFASLVMLEVLNVTNQRFGLGLEERLSDLRPRVQAMVHKLPDE